MAYRLLQKLQIARPPGKQTLYFCRISKNSTPSSTVARIQAHELRIRQGNESDEGEFESNSRTEHVPSPGCRTL